MWFVVHPNVFVDVADFTADDTAALLRYINLRKERYNAERRGIIVAAVALACVGAVMTFHGVLFGATTSLIAAAVAIVLSLIAAAFAYTSRLSRYVGVAISTLSVHSTHSVYDVEVYGWNYYVKIEKISVLRFIDPIFTSIVPIDVSDESCDEYK